MFAKIAALSTLLPLAAAQVSVILQTPTAWTSGVQANISWSTTDAATRFSLELVNPMNFHNAYAVATNVDPTLDFLSLALPIVPAGDGYYLQAVNVTDIYDVYGQSGQFSVAQTPSTVTSASSASAVTYTSSFVSTSSASVASSGSVSSSGASPSSTAPSSSASAPASASSPASTNFNGSPARFDFSLGSWAVMAVGAIAGAVVAL